MHLRPIRYVSRLFLLLLPLSALLLAACGPSPAIVLELSDGSLAVVLGGSAQTEVTLTRTGGASADVTLDAAGAPDWVTVSFAPSVLTAGTLTSTMTVTTDGDHPSAEVTSFTLTVTAVGTGLTASDELTVQSDFLTVTGQTQGVFGGSVTGVNVSIDGGTPVPVDAEGKFEIEGVVIPYDLLAFDDSKTWAHLYQGLTTPTVTLMEMLSLVAPPAATTVSGDLSVAVGANQSAFVCLEGVEEPLLAPCDVLNPAETAYSLSVNWFEGSNKAANVRAWVVDMDSGAVTGYPLVGQKAVELTDGVPTVADVALEPGPDSVTVDVTITPPPGIPLTTSTVVFGYSENGGLPLPPAAPGTATTYSVVVPDMPGATLTVIGQASGLSTGTAIQSVRSDYASGSVGLVMDAVPVLVSPADGATGVNHETEFTAHSSSGGPITYNFQGAQNLRVTSDEPSVSIPDLTSIGMALPAATNYTWGTISTPGHQSVDDVASEGLLAGFAKVFLAVLTGGDPGTSGLTQSATRSFTTE